MVLQLPAPVWLIPTGIIGLLLIVLFMTPRNKLKGNAIDHAMLPLDIIGCLVDVISYIRLFAVGMASLYVARNFNQMATGIGLPLSRTWSDIPLKRRKQAHGYWKPPHRR